MSIVSCPRCRDEVTVPSKASPNALVRCPLCREQYLLEEALDQLPPALIVLSGGYGDDEGELVGAGVGEYSVAGEMGGGYDRGMVPDSVFSTGGPGGTALADSGVAAPTPRITGTPRPKRKPKSAVVEIVKVVLGGVVGLTAGMAILWWAFGKDPLELGPKVSEYAPWIVPAQFHGKKAKQPSGPTTADTSSGSTIAANTGGGTPSVPETPGPNAPPPSGFGGQDLEAELRNFNAGNPNAQPPSPPANDSAFSSPAGDDPLGTLDPNVDPIGGNDPLSIENPLAAFDMEDPEMKAPGTNPLNSLDSPPDLSPTEDADTPLPETPAPETPSPETTTPAAPDPFAPPAPMPDPFALPTGDSPAPEVTTPAPMPPEPNATEPSPPAPTTDTPEPEGVAPAAIEQTVTSTAAARVAFDDSKGKIDNEARKQLATEMYNEGAKLGPMLAQAAKDDADFAATLEKVNAELYELGAPARRSTLAFLTIQRLDSPDEETGAVFVGTVKEFRSVGSMYEMMVELPGRATRTVAVVSESDPQKTFQVGDNAVVVGRVVRNPQKDLPKYGGEQTIVVEQGHALPIAAQ